MASKRRVKVLVQADAVEWVLVRFVEDDVLSTPIRLDSIIDEESGLNGVEKDLQSGDYCQAPYEDGHLYNAKILLRTSEKEKVLKDRKILMSAKSGNGNEKKERKVVKKTAPKKVVKKSSKKPKDDDENGEEGEHQNKKTKKELLEERKKRDESRKETLQHAQDYILSSR